MASCASNSCSRPSVWAPKSALLAAMLTACGGGGGSGASAPGSMPNAYLESLNGDYVVQSSSIELDSGYSMPFPTGLESTILRITLFAVVPMEGGEIGSAGAYSLQSPGIDFRSLAQPEPNGSAVAIARDTPPDGSFAISGIHFLEGPNLTVELFVTHFDDFSTTVFLSDGFAKRFAFRMFIGNQKAVEHERTNGLDDDSDGLVDEADENESYDVIDPSATPVSEGRLTLSFRR